MSVLSNFSLPNISGVDLSDSRKVKAILDSLRMLDENMRYAMNNLEPEDNFSSSALKTYNGLISDVKKIGSDGKIYKTLIEQNAEAINLEAQRAIGQEVEIAAALKVASDQISLKVSSDGIISAINQSAEEISIAANKINLNGAVTANNYFKINKDGSVEASAITIGGKNSKINIQTSDTTYDVIALNYKDGTHTLLTGLKPGELRAEYDDQVASMDGMDGLSFWNLAGTIDALYGENCYTKGYGEFVSGIYIGKNTGIVTRYGNAVLIQDYGNGNVSMNAAGNQLLLGYKNTAAVLVDTDFDVSGSKNRIVSTSKGKVRMGAYEMTEPYFGDIGSGVIESDGRATVNIESLFLETVSIKDYKVFLQGGVKLLEKYDNCFVVGGAPGEEFDWEIKAHQKGYENNRMEIIGG